MKGHQYQCARQAGRMAPLVALVVVVGLAGACSDDSKAPADAGPDVPIVVGDRGPERGPDGPGQGRELIILHTNDLHSQIDGFSPISEYTPDVTGNDSTVGGFARLAALVKTERATAGTTPVLLLDAGDYMTGSLFGWLMTTKYAELRLMDQMGYDGIGMGNHELDLTATAFGAMADAAIKGGLKAPLLAPANLKADALGAAQALLKKKVVKTLANGLKVGLFAIVGKGAAKDATLYGSPADTFGDAAAAAQAAVKELRETDKVDVVICLSHSGIETDGTGEDADLAKAVPGIDVIVSGHTHTQLDKPVTVDKTTIVQAGAQGKHLGKLGLKVQEGTITVTKSALLPVDDKVQGDAALQTAVTGLIADIDALLTVAGSPFTYKKVLAETSFDLTFPEFQETIMGDIIVDAYLATVKALQPTDPPQIAVDSGGVIGDEILKGKQGKIWFADAYRADPKGVGPDKLPGYPLVTFYLTGKELKAGMEVLAAAKSFLKSGTYFLQVAGMQVEYQAAGMPLGSVTSIKVGSPPVAVDFSNTTTCYKMVTNLLVASQLAEVKSVSLGLLSIEPKEKDCATKIADLKTRIVDRDPATAGVQELKAWQAVAGYLSQLPDTNGNSVPDVPALYQATQGRIVAK